MQKFKKITAVLLSALMLFASASVFAEPEATEKPTKKKNAEIYMENPELTAPDTDHAESALLMDMTTGRVIYSKNSDKKAYPASTTKMMTAILALESDKMGDTVVAPYEALKSITLEDSHMGILVGEELTMTDLLNGMLVYSANDAANVIAIHIGGSMEGFVDLMNAKATELGMKGTHFVNACGVHAKNHYTTADDLAILARYCMQNEKFREIVAKPTYHIDPTNKYVHNRDLPATNLFLSTARSANHLYKPCTGIKTGTTDAAGHCLVSSATYEDMNLLAVVLKCDDENVTDKAYSYIVSRALFDFGFNNYESGVLAAPGTVVADSKVFAAKKDKRVTFTVDSDVTALIPIGQDISKEIKTSVTLDKNPIEAPIEKGEVLGTIVYTYHGKEIAKCPLIAANDVERNWLVFIFYKTLEKAKNPLILIPGILIILAIIFAALSARKKKRRMARRKKFEQIHQRCASEDGNNVYAQKRAMRNSELNRTSSKGSTSRYSSDSKE